MPIVEIRRGPDTVGVFRSLIVSCDGHTMARLRRNRSVKADVDVGSHRFVGSMDWVSSAPLDIEISEGEHVLLQASIGWTGFTTVLSAVLRFRARSVNPPGMVTVTRIS